MHQFILIAATALLPADSAEAFLEDANIALERGDLDGAQEAVDAGKLLVSSGVLPDVVHTSLQTRAILTANLALAECERLWVPVRRSWRLNERHYGALTGLNKQQTKDLHGEEKVHEWRRSYSTRPPSMPEDHPHNPNTDVRYHSVPGDLLPATECLADVVDRLVPYWEGPIAEDFASFNTILVAAHGNSLRALVKHLDGLSDAEVLNLDIPTGAPILYELNPNLAPSDSVPVSERYLI